MIVPDKFNMVDMEGIDLLRMQGAAVEGLYDKLVESIALCRYQCLYNWKFNDILIPPSYVEMEVGEDEEVIINFGITVTSDDVIHLQTIEPTPVEPVIIPLFAEENMVYNVPSGVDGFDPVTVDVPSYTPVIESITITENGVYTVPSGIDGYGPITVDVSGSNYYEFTVTVDGGYNGGAVVVVICENTSGQVISATGNSPYNLQYTPNSANTTIDGHTVSVAIPDLPNFQSDLNVQVSFDGVTKTVSFHYTGNNTSYGYGHQSDSMNFIV